MFTCWSRMDRSDEYLREINIPTTYTREIQSFKISWSLEGEKLICNSYKDMKMVQRDWDISAIPNKISEENIYGSMPFCKTEIDGVYAYLRMANETKILDNNRINPKCIL